MKAIIEMPKGNNRRRHFKFDKTGFIDLGPIKDIIPVNDGIMPVNYGYICDTLNEDEGDEIDVLIFSENIFNVGDVIDIEPIAIMNREDGDDKVVAIDASIKHIKTWEDISESERKLIEEFFSYHHKFKSIENAEAAKLYIEEGLKQYLIKK